MVAAPTPARIVRTRSARCRIPTGTAATGVRPFVPVVYPAGHDDILLISTTPMRGKPARNLAEVRGAKIDKPSWVLNGVGTMGFSCSAWNDAMDHLVIPGSVVDGAGVMRLIGREVTLYRDGVARWLGPPVTARISLDGTVSFSCMDSGWHLARKFFGAAERRDYLNGIGSMDAAGLPGWILAGSASKARDTVDRRRGKGSMVLSGNGAVTASFTIPARPVTGPVHLAGEVKVPTGTPVGTPVMSITVYDADTGAVIDSATITVDESTMLGQWQRVSTYAIQRNRTRQRVTVALWSPGDHGSTKFDDVRSLENNTTGLPLPGKDLVRHAMAAVDHLQGGRGQGLGFGFRPRMVAPTGTVEVLGERHVNHTQWTDFIARYTSRDDGLDWKINPRTRDLDFGPRQGRDHENLALHERIVRAGEIVHDETAIAAKVVVPFESDGVDRPEGGYTDTSRTAGLMYDDFWQPPAGTPLSAIDPMARQRWDKVSQPQISLDGLAISDKYLGTVEEGDTLSGQIRVGKFRGRHRHADARHRSRPAGAALMDPDTRRARPPAKRTTETDIIKDHEAEKRRQQRPVVPTTTTARRVAVGVYESPTVDTPTTITVPLPSGCTWFIVSVAFSGADDGAQGAHAGPSDSFAYSAPYIDGGSVQYSWPAHGATTHAIHARISGPDGDYVGSAKATIFTF